MVSAVFLVNTFVFIVTFVIYNLIFMLYSLYDKIEACHQRILQFEKKKKLKRERKGYPCPPAGWLRFKP